MISILGGISWKSLTGSTDDDWIDRANHLWTVCLLLLFAVVVSSGQYVGDPIHCWCPAEFTGTFVAYTKNYCWISNTYFVPMETGIPRDIAQRQKAELNYYQWVPLILVFMAFLFKAPHIIWHLLNTKAGINLNKINELTDSVHVGKPEDREESLKHIAKYIDRWLRQNRNYHRNILVKVRQRISNVFIFCFAKRDGYFLTGFYLFTKMLYCVNCVAQFFILDSFLGMDFGGYGFEILSYFREHGEWKETPRFPRVTLCDFKIRQLENIQTFTVQCVLPINLFNEKIFAMIWFWLFFLAILTFYNLASWLFYLLFRHNKEMFVRKYLRACNEIQSGFDKKLSRRFANDYLREDGCFLLRIVGKNSTDIILSDLTRLLWNIFKEKPFQSRKNLGDFDDDTPLTNDLSSPVRYRSKPDKIMSDV
ncbi:innexin unc-9-like [Mercenaria mercenaria]|uniref:innexin unc-9-like n=1 Tax=Mercenaria mercenaria TaxID=6596 RepID=UPI00234F5DB6|nr:innexin unc-9-like [Mercenaria mercenaria]